MSPRDADGNYKLPPLGNPALSEPLDMNAQLDELWRHFGGWQALADVIEEIPSPAERAKFLLEVAKVRARKEVTGEGGGPVLIQLKQI